MRLYDYGLSILEQYQLTAAKSSRIRGALLCHTEKGLLVVKENYNSENALQQEQKLMQKIVDHGFFVPLYVENQEGMLISCDKDGIPYTVQLWYEGKECDVKSREDIRKSIAHLANMHNIMIGEISEHNRENSLYEEYLRHNQQLRKIQKFIRKKGPVNSFEKDFFYSAEWFIKRAEAATEKLGKSSYEKIRQSMINDGKVCHGNYNQHNIMMTKNGIIITNFKHWKYDIQILDLYDFLRKIMEKYDWNVGWARELLEIYHKIKPISKQEWEILSICFTYPEKYWKLSNHYYTHNKAWISEKNIEKMRKVIDQKEVWIQFVEQCFAKYPFEDN